MSLIPDHGVVLSTVAGLGQAQQTKERLAALGGRFALASARIQLRLPCTVLISPLWAR